MRIAHDGANVAPVDILWMTKMIWTEMKWKRHSDVPAISSEMLNGQFAVPKILRPTRTTCTLNVIRRLRRNSLMALSNAHASTNFERLKTNFKSTDLCLCAQRLKMTCRNCVSSPYMLRPNELHYATSWALERTPKIPRTFPSNNSHNNRIHFTIASSDGA